MLLKRKQEKAQQPGHCQFAPSFPSTVAFA
jgi:hypothetical protein